MEWELDAVQRDFLKHPNRCRIVELLAENPGLNKSQIARALGLELTTAHYHVDRLESVDLLETRASPRSSETVCFLPTQTALWDDPRTRILFGGSRVRHVASLVLDRPGITAHELGEALGLSSGGVHHHVHTLLDHGLVERFRLGRGYRYYPTPVLEDWRQAVPDLEPDDGPKGPS